MAHREGIDQELDHRMTTRLFKTTVLCDNRSEDKSLKIMYANSSKEIRFSEGMYKKSRKPLIYKDLRLLFCLCDHSLTTVRAN